MSNLKIRSDKNRVLIVIDLTYFIYQTKTCQNFAQTED